MATFDIFAFLQKRVGEMEHYGMHVLLSGTFDFHLSRNLKDSLI